MKVKAVSALRSKRGLRPVVRVAEPQVVGLTPQTTNERRANTMKTYLLRESQTVEPQKARRTPRPRPAASTAREGLNRPIRAHTGPVLFVGLDVHTESIAVSLAPADGSEVRRYGMIGGTHDDVLRLAKKLHAAHPDTQLR